MKSNFVKQIVKPWLIGRRLKWSSQDHPSSQPDSFWESEGLDKLWRGAKKSKPWPEILPPHMDDLYFNELKLSIMEKIKAKRFQVD